MVNGLFCFLEEDRTTPDFLGIITLAIGQEKQPHGHPPCAGQAVWFSLGAQGGRDGVKNWWLYHRTDCTSSAFSPPVDSTFLAVTGIRAAWPGRQYSLQRTCYAKSLQSCPTLCDPIDGSPPGSPVPGILQARTKDMNILKSASLKETKLQTLQKHLLKNFMNLLQKKPLFFLMVFCTSNKEVMKSFYLFIYFSGEGNGTSLQYSCLENPWTEEPSLFN